MTHGKEEIDLFCQHVHSSYTPGMYTISHSYRITPRHIRDQRLTIQHITLCMWKVKAIEPGRSLDETDDPIPTDFTHTYLREVP